MNLGLNSQQAKIYFTLARFGPSSVVEIAKQLKVNPSDTYCILLKLYELGLVEKTVKPYIKFKAVSADQALKFLLQRKIQPQQDIAKSVSSNKEKCEKIKNKSGIVLIPHKEQVIKNAIKSIENAHESIDLTISWDFFSEFVYDAIPEKLNPKVPKRCILEQPSNRNSLDLIKKFKEDSYTLRYIQTKPKAMLAIFDKKEVIVIEDPVDLRDSPALWTNNQNMLIMAMNYFDNLWRKSTLKPM